MPTTTSQPAARSAATVSPSWRTASWAGLCRVTSLAPIMITAMSGRQARACSSWPARSADRPPENATFTSRTGRSATEARPAASSAPGVSRARSTPSPAAVESPRKARTRGGCDSAALSAKASP